MRPSLYHRGWSVVLAGTGINLALGILYTWSIFKGAIRASIEGGGPFQWDLASINDPYAVCCLAFALAMAVAGKCQDRLGPRITALVGGLLVGAGFVWISRTTSYGAWVLGFGVLAGTGIGFGYSAATPPALKWFPPARTGLVAGIVVSGFGLASVYIAPLAKYLLGRYGLQTSMLFFGVAFAAVVSALALLLVNPPPGFLFKEAVDQEDKARRAKPSVKVQGDYRPSEMLRTINFYTLWATFFIGSGAGLMVIGSVAGMAKRSLGELAFVAVATMAVGNAAGRIVAGVLSDRIGRSRTLVLMLAFQAALMFLAIPVIGSGSPWLLVLLATFIGFNYGTNLSLFPSFAKDFWGLKNFGTNYGVLFSAWGAAGLVMGRLSQMLTAATGSYDLSFLAAGVLLIAAAGLALTLREGKTRQWEDALQQEGAAQGPTAPAEPEVSAAR
ncbi:MAG: OFA family MFS transporter [Deferrisomatales bacterium]